MKEIKSIISAYDSIDHDRIKCALAIVVNVEGSSYRRIGARMLVMSDGSWIGGISGGCLEGDALRRANYAIFKGEPSMVTYDTTQDDDRQIGIGLGCNGIIEVLFIPIDTTMDNHPITELRSVSERREEQFIYTITSSDTSRWQVGQSGRATDQMIMNLGTDTNLWFALKHKRRSMLIASDTVTYVLEYIAPQLRVIIAGDSYDINAMVSMSHLMGWEIHIVGKMNKIDKSICQLCESVYEMSEIDEIEFDEFTAVVIMGHDINKDREALAYFGPRHNGYLGVLGPVKRLMKMTDELDSTGIDISFSNQNSFYNPIGLDIGAEGPEEIALACIAEIVGYYNGKALRSLKFKDGPIHDRVV